MAGTTKGTVTWELVGDLEESAEGRVVVDVEAPLRPFGSIPTPPKGIPAVVTSPAGTLTQKGRSLAPLLENPALDEVTDEALLAFSSLDVAIDTASASGEGEAF